MTPLAAGRPSAAAVTVIWPASPPACSSAAFAVNAELVLLYWSVGHEISRRMQEHGWGSKVVDQLAGDLRREIPDMKGFSLLNLRYMRSFAEAWPDGPILQAPPAKLT